MTFTLTATPDTVSIPPRVLLEATESDSAKPIQSCQFFRDGVALRFAANIAGDTAIAYDYDAPFDQALDYRADAVALASLVLAWTDTFTDLSAWGTPIGWTASGGKAQTTVEIAGMSRVTTDPIARVAGTNPAFSGTATTGSFWIGVVLADGFSQVILKFSIEDQRILLTSPNGTNSVTGQAPTSFVIDFADDSVTASGSGWSLTVPNESPAGSRVRMEVDGAFTGTRTVTLDDLTVYASVVPATLADVTASDTATLTGITAAWLTNAQQPELAIQVTPDASSDDHICFSPETLRETTAVSSSVALDIEGSPDTLTVVTGPRRNKVGSAELICLDTAARRTLETLLANNAPVGIRFPAVLDYMALDDGFYAVGDLGLNRVQNPWDTRDEVTLATLPLTPSRPPAFDVLWQWTYNTLAQTGLTYDQTAATFPTYTDLLIGPTT